NDTGTVALSSGSPALIDGEGNTAFYAVHTFDVSKGVDYLNGEIAWNAQQARGNAVFETLFDPQGRVAAYSLLGRAGQSGRGHVEVRQPSAGAWTAAIFTVDNHDPASTPVYTRDV